MLYHKYKTVTGIPLQVWRKVLQTRQKDRYLAAVNDQNVGDITHDWENIESELPKLPLSFVQMVQSNLSTAGTFGF